MNPEEIAKINLEELTRESVAAFNKEDATALAIRVIKEAPHKAGAFTSAADAFVVALAQAAKSEEFKASKAPLTESLPAAIRASGARVRTAIKERRFNPKEFGAEIAHIGGHGAAHDTMSAAGHFLTEIPQDHKNVMRKLVKAALETAKSAVKAVHM